MKSIKKILALAIAMVMVLSMGVAVFAAEGESTVAPSTATISTKKEGHTYKIFQIFTGEPDGSGGLVDLKYGHNTAAGKTVGATVVQDDIDYFTDLAKNMASMNNQEKLAAVAGYVTVDDSSAIATVTSEASASVPTGYYLIKDLDDSQDGQDEGYTLYIMNVIAAGENFEIKPKASTPEVEKKVKDKDDTAGTTTEWQDTADHDIGDAIDYKLTGTLPNTFADYASYKTYTFTDTLSDGLTPPSADGIKVTMDTEDGADLSGIFDIAVDGQTITVSLKEGADLKTDSHNFTADSKIIVTYQAVLNNQAVIGKEGNPNTVTLEYTNNPNSDGEGDKGKTPEDTVIVFTYKTVVDKIDQDGNDLTGADFTLYKEVPAGTANAVLGSAIEFAAGVEHTAIDAAKYYVIAGQKTGSSSGSQFSFEGIDDGTYVLVETTVPEGYNAWKSVSVTVTAKHGEDATGLALTELKATAPFTESNVEAGTVDRTKAGTTHSRESGEAYAEIINQNGATLPSTGGMGTTIIYIIGAILLVGAGVLLVTKKRMAK